MSKNLTIEDRASLARTLRLAGLPAGEARRIAMLSPAGIMRALRRRATK